MSENPITQGRISMFSKPRWLLAVPLALAATLGVGSARASTIRDNAGMFSKEAIRQAESELNKVERDTQLATTIETIPTLEGESIEDVTLRHARRSGTEGLYILMAKQEAKIRILASQHYRRAMDDSREEAIRSAFRTEFKNKDFDAGLLAGVKKISTEAAAARAELGTLRQAGPPARRAGARVVRPGAGGGFGLGSLIGIGLLIVGVLFVVRLLGSLFGGGYAGAGAPGRMGAPYGPGYGGGGGGGGGFMSGLFGGLGGALAGNWLYDQFSGRHHGGSVDNASYDPGTTGEQAPADEWGGGGGVTGDWGGGDAGGGGGGDWGGGGGDWGGGGGGGDW
jgi:uncharacterized protein